MFANFNNKKVYFNESVVIKGAIVVIFASILMIILRPQFLALYSRLTGKSLESPGEITAQMAGGFQKGGEKSEPLVAKNDFRNAVLTEAGIVALTNKHRAENNLPPLTVNQDLRESAKVKADDMFAKQYFEHDSPEGIGADVLAKDAGYDFILIGENLALGNFSTDAVLVQGWMDSPGHKANILHSRYTEIGVSVIQGTYQGRKTWMAVQHFGFPISACPNPSPSLKSQIDTNNARLTQLEAELTARKAELDTLQGDPTYNQKAQEYNDKVSEYNQLLEATKALIADYNGQVAVFNNCAS